MRARTRTHLQAYKSQTCPGHYNRHCATRTHARKRTEQIAQAESSHRMHLQSMMIKPLLTWLSNAPTGAHLTTVAPIIVRCDFNAETVHHRTRNQMQTRKRSAFHESQTTARSIDRKRVVHNFEPNRMARPALAHRSRR